MASITDLKKTKIRLVLTIISITFLTIFLVYFLVRSLSNEEALHKSEVNSMNKKLKTLNERIGTLKLEYKRLNKVRDSLKYQVDYFWPMRYLIYTAKLRDQVGDALDLNPGDIAILKTDSSRVIVIDIKVGGNDLSYYVNYTVKTSKGELREVSPYEITKNTPKD